LRKGILNERKTNCKKSQNSIKSERLLSENKSKCGMMENYHSLFTVIFFSENIRHMKKNQKQIPETIEIKDFTLLIKHKHQAS